MYKLKRRRAEKGGGESWEDITGKSDASEALREVSMSEPIREESSFTRDNVVYATIPDAEYERSLSRSDGKAAMLFLQPWATWAEDAVRVQERPAGSIMLWAEV